MPPSAARIGGAVAVAVGKGLSMGVGPGVGSRPGPASDPGVGSATGLGVLVGFGVGRAVGRGVARGAGFGVGFGVGLGVGFGVAAGTGAIVTEPAPRLAFPRFLDAWAEIVTGWVPVESLPDQRKTTPLRQSPVAGPVIARSTLPIFAVTRSGLAPLLFL